MTDRSITKDRLAKDRLAKDRPDTLLATLGRDPQRHAGAVNIPINRTSTIIFPTVDDLKDAERGRFIYGSYGRYGTPTTRALEDMLATLEGADHALLTASGVSAVTTALMSVVSQHDHLLVADCVYGPTRTFCDHELKRFGVEVTYFDPTIGANIATLMRPNTRAVFLEAPGSLTFEMQDIPAIAEVAHAHGALALADNTWATPLYLRPFELGIDISIHSATKYIGGHSDLLMGVMSTTKDVYPHLLRTHKHLGACTNAEDCYLALRGLRSMKIRLERQQASALKIAEWLLGRPEVQEVRYPAMPGSHGHELWKRYFTGGAALFGVLLKPGFSETALAAMLDGMRLFAMGYSWGGYESLILPVPMQDCRTAVPWSHQGHLLRLHIGLEDVDDLIADLAEGLERLGGKRDIERKKSGR